MATVLRCRGTAFNNEISGNSFDWANGKVFNTLVGGTARFIHASLDDAVGDGVNTVQSNTVAGPTAGIEFNSTRLDFISEPLAADVTISGTIAVALWGLESGMNANCTLGCLIERIDSVGDVVSEIGRGTGGAAELGTGATQITFNITPTSTNMLKGDRIRVTPYLDDAGTMATGFTANLRFDGATNGADGDSKITLTETLSFITSDPAGTQIFLTDTASAVATASVDREAWTSRGAGVQSDVTLTANSPASPLQITDTSGGTVVDWFTKQLAAFTLGGAVLVNRRASESSTVAGAALRVEIAIVDNDGTNPVIWAASQHWTEIPTTENADQFYVSGPDTAVAAGKRLRIRLYHFNAESGTEVASALFMTVFYAGTSGGASGDFYLTFTQTLTEHTPTVEGSFTANAIIKKERTGSFTLDASIFKPGAAQFTADAVIRKPDQSFSFTANSVLRKSQSASFTGDAIKKKTIVHAEGNYFEEYGDIGLIYLQALAYLTAADGPGEIQGGGGNPPQVGQAFNFSGGGYYFVGQYMLRFDLSALDPAAVVQSAVLWLDGHGDNSNVDFEIQARKDSFSNPVNAYDNFRTATELATKPLLGVLNSSAWIFDTNVNTRQWNFIDLDVDEITLGVNFDIILCSKEQVDKSAPGATTAGDEYVRPAHSIFGEGPKLELVFGQGDPFTLDARIARGGSYTINAILRKLNQPGSFTVDAVIASAGGGTVEKVLDFDAVIRKERTGSFTADAVLVRTTSATFTANSVIKKTQTPSFTANAVIYKQQANSFTLGAWIYAPREDPDGPGEPGETPLVSIVVDGVDITADVLIADAMFTMLVNGAPGQFKFRVRDDGHTHDFTTGAEVTLDIDGKRKFGGYLTLPMRGFAFPVQDTTDPDAVTRYWTLEGPDYNILFSKRVLYDKDDPASVGLRRWAAGSDDDDVIRYVITHYTDLLADGVTLDGVEHIGSPNPDKTGVVGSGGLTVGDAMREINRLLSGVWYIDQYKVLNFVDVDIPNAEFELSDNPGPGQVGFRDFSHIENGTKLANDAMVWGAGMGPSTLLKFAREQDSASIAAHGRWQYGEYTTNMFRQASVDLRAETVVDGTPQSRRGGKDDQVAWAATTFERSFAVGQKVQIESEVFGTSDVVPIRRFTCTFPVKNKPMYLMVLSHEIDLPWNLFEFWFPKFQFDPPRFDDGPQDSFPPSDCTTPVFGGCANTVIGASDRFLTAGPLHESVTACAMYISYEGVESDGTRAVITGGLGDIGVAPHRASNLPQCLLTIWDMTNAVGDATFQVGRSSAKDNGTPDVDYLAWQWHEPFDGMVDLVVIKSNSQANYNNVAIPDKFIVRQEWTGDTHNVKIWGWDEDEPAGWQYTHTDTDPIQSLAIYAAMEYRFGAGDVYCHGYVFASGSGEWELNSLRNDTTDSNSRAWAFDQNYLAPWGEGANGTTLFQNGSVAAHFASFDLRVDWEDWFQPAAAGAVMSYSQNIMAIPIRTPYPRDDDWGLRGSLTFTGQVRILKNIGPGGEVVIPATVEVVIRQYTDPGEGVQPTWPSMNSQDSLYPAAGGTPVWSGTYEGGDGSVEVIVPVEFTIPICPDYVILGVSLEGIQSQELVTQLGPWGGPIVGGPHREYGSDLDFDTVVMSYIAPSGCGVISLCVGDGSSSPLVSDEGNVGQAPDRVSSTVYQLVSAFHERSTRVFVNGYFQRLGFEYTEDPAAGQIIFASPVDIADVVWVLYDANGSPD